MKVITTEIFDLLINELLVEVKHNTSQKQHTKIKEIFDGIKATKMLHERVLRKDLVKALNDKYTNQSEIYEDKKHGSITRN